MTGHQIRHLARISTVDFLLTRELNSSAGFLNSGNAPSPALFEDKETRLEKR